MSENWNHVLFGLFIEVMHAVSFVEDIPQQLRGRSVDNGRRYHIRHIPVILILVNLEFGMRVESAKGPKMNIATTQSVRLVDGVAKLGVHEPKYCDPHRLFRSQLLQLFHEPVPLGFVILSGPVVV